MLDQATSRRLFRRRARKGLDPDGGAREKNIPATGRRGKRIIRAARDEMAAPGGRIR